MVYTSNNIKHTIHSELGQVHTQLRAKYDLQKQAQNDMIKAKEMETYLRMFKAVGNQEANNFGIQAVLVQEGMQELIAEIGKRLGIGSYNLFRNQHKWYLDAQQRWGADDVFEAELATLLQVAGEKAIGNVNAKTGVQVLGSLTGNISQEFFQELKDSGEDILSKTAKPTEVINSPHFRAIKTDVSGYSADFQLSSTLAPQWEHFINLFTGAKFTVKNYSSNSSYEVIHLGNSNLFKAILATLYNIGFNTKESMHIYYHAMANKYQTNPKVQEHLQHLRFAYELTGGGLYDSQGNSLDEADFFVYNDPSSNNIWVRSTKEMISNVLNYTGGSEGSLHSGIVVLKHAFN